MNKNKVMPSLKIESELFEAMKKAIEKLNNETKAELNISRYRRLCYKTMTTFILSGKLSAQEILMR